MKYINAYRKTNRQTDIYIIYRLTDGHTERHKDTEILTDIHTDDL